MAGPMTHAELQRYFDGLETQLPTLLARCREPGERVRAFEHATAPFTHAQFATAADATYARRRLHGLLLVAGLVADEGAD